MQFVDVYNIGRELVETKVLSNNCFAVVDRLSFALPSQKCKN